MIKWLNSPQSHVFQFDLKGLCHAISYLFKYLKCVLKLPDLAKQIKLLFVCIEVVLKAHLIINMCFRFVCVKVPIVKRAS